MQLQGGPPQGRQRPRSCVTTAATQSKAMQVVGTRHPGRSSSYLLGEPAGLIFSQVFSLISSACFLKEENKYAAEGMQVDAVRRKTGSPWGRLFLSNLICGLLDIRSGINLSSLSSKKAAGQGLSLPGEGGQDGQNPG